MIEPYLIAHLVRGQPAFDIAERSPCMFCKGYETISGEFIPPAKAEDECNYCQDGWQWQIPTSGHRAYPYWSTRICPSDDFRTMYINDQRGHVGIDFDLPSPPSDLSDHYAISDARDAAKIEAWEARQIAGPQARSLLEGLGLLRQLEIRRR